MKQLMIRGPEYCKRNKTVNLIKITSAELIAIATNQTLSRRLRIIEKIQKHNLTTETTTDIICTTNCMIRITQLMEQTKDTNKKPKYKNRKWSETSGVNKNKKRSKYRRDKYKDN